VDKRVARMRIAAIWPGMAAVTRISPSVEPGTGISTRMILFHPFEETQEQRGNVQQQQVNLLLSTQTHGQVSTKWL
jgi:hypothetical protein